MPPSVARPRGAPRPGAAPVARGAGRAPAPRRRCRPVAPGRATASWTARTLRPTCTVAQLRRFIKSRPWIPMHELRRRFGIYGGDDDVSPIRVGEHDAVHRPAARRRAA